MSADILYLPRDVICRTPNFMPVLATVVSVDEHRQLAAFWTSNPAVIKQIRCCDVFELDEALYREIISLLGSGVTFPQLRRLWSRAESFDPARRTNQLGWAIGRRDQHLFPKLV